MGRLACHLPIRHEIADIVVGQFDFKPVWYHGYHIPLGRDIGYFRAFVGPPLFPFKLQLSRRMIIREMHVIRLIFYKGIRLKVAFQLMETNQLFHKRPFPLEKLRALQQFNPFLHPSTIAQGLQDTTLPRTLRPDKDIDSLQINIHVPQRPQIMNLYVFHAEKSIFACKDTGFCALCNGIFCFRWIKRKGRTSRPIPSRLNLNIYKL